MRHFYINMKNTDHRPFTRILKFALILVQIYLKLHFSIKYMDKEIFMLNFSIIRARPL